MDAILGSARGRFAQARATRRSLLLTCAIGLVALGWSPVRSQQQATSNPGAGRDTRKPTDWEHAWNQYGDPWAQKGPPNPSIPIGPGTTTFTILGPDTPEQPPDDEIHYLGNANGTYLYDDGAKLLQPGKEFVLDVPGRPAATYSSARVREYLARITQVNPDLRYIGYLTPNELSGYYNGFDEIMTSHPEWLVTDPAEGHPLQVVYTLAGGQRVLGEYLVDLGNAEYRAFIAQKAAESMRYHGFGGVLLDQCADRFVTGHVYNGTVPESYRAGWPANVRETVRAVKQAAPDLDIFLSPYDQDETFMRSLLRAGGDGYFFENPLGPATDDIDVLVGSGRLGLPYTWDTIALNRQEGKKVLLSQSDLGPGGIGTASADRDEALRRYLYYLALYLVFLSSPAADVHYVYYTDNLRGAVYFQDGDVRIGAPTGNAQALADRRVWQREFEHGRVYVNVSNRPALVNLGRRLYDARRQPYEGTQTVPARAGLILGTWDALPGTS